MKVTGYLLRGNGATVTFDDGSIFELVYDTNLQNSNLSDDKKNAITEYLNKLQSNNIDPRFGSVSGVIFYRKDITASDWVDMGGYYDYNIPQSEHGISLVLDGSVRGFSGTELISIGGIIIDTSDNIAIARINTAPMDSRIIVYGI